jgi:hypothetical protein
LIDRKDILIRIVYGHGGKGFSIAVSPGLIKLRDRLAGMGYTVRDDISWRDPDYIVADFNGAAGFKKKVMIGHSLGANCITWVSNKPVAPIDLAVAYDPSWGVPVLMPAPIERVSHRIKRCLHYRGLAFPVGGAQLSGPTVETIETWIPHLWITDSEWLHGKTFDALTALEG